MSTTKKSPFTPPDKSRMRKLTPEEAKQYEEALKRMDKALAKRESSLPAQEIHDTVEAYFQSKSPHTIQAFESDLYSLACFLFKFDPAGQRALSKKERGVLRRKVIDYLVESGPKGAFKIAVQFKAHLLSKGLSPGTVNRRLSAIRMALKIARMISPGMSWTIEIPGEKSESEPVTGPGEDEFRKMLKAAKTKRDRAILACLGVLGLRRGEACALNMGDFDREGKKLSVKQKARRKKVLLTIPARTAALIEAWIGEERYWLEEKIQDRSREWRAKGSPAQRRIERKISTDQGLIEEKTIKTRGGQSRRVRKYDTNRAALFFCDKGPFMGSRLSGEGIRMIVEKISEEALGKAIRPHQLRHCAISAACRRLNGNVSKLSLYARHAHWATTQRYVDQDRDIFGEVAALVDDLVEAE